MKRQKEVLSELSAEDEALLSQLSSDFFNRFKTMQYNQTLHFNVQGLSDDSLNFFARDITVRCTFCCSCRK